MHARGGSVTPLDAYRDDPAMLRACINDIMGTLALLEGGKVALANPQTRTPEHAEIVELRKKVASLERSLGRKTYELDVAGELSRDWT